MPFFINLISREKHMKKKSFFYFSTAILAALLFYFFFAFVKKPQDSVESQQQTVLAETTKQFEPRVALSDQTSSDGAKPIAPPPLVIQRRNSSSPEKLPFEYGLLLGKSMDSKKIQSLLFSKEFDEQIDAFANQSLADPDASELSSIYKKMLEKQMKNNKIKIKLRRLVCGTSICVGTMENGNDSEYARWSGVFLDDSATPNYGFVNSTISVGADQFENRFVFSTDPEANSITVPHK